MPFYMGINKVSLSTNDLHKTIEIKGQEPEFEANLYPTENPHSALTPPDVIAQHTLYWLTIKEIYSVNKPEMMK